MYRRTKKYTAARQAAMQAGRASARMARPPWGFGLTNELCSHAGKPHAIDL